MTVLFSTASGLAGFAADIREFIAAVRFAHPEALWALLLLPVVGLVNFWAKRRGRRSVGLIGRPATVAGQLTQPGGRWSWLGLAYPCAWVLLVLGLAGPRWGKSDETGVVVGRDLVLVIDLSRSMRAEDVNVPPGGWTKTDAKEKFEPKRWLAAREAALDLLSGISQRGGHRLGVIVFAAHARVLCPLTSDYNHVRTVIEEIDGDHPPIECRPGQAEVISGTRIGAALAEAVALHDQRYPGYQDIILFSDGDDPGDDAATEWRHGSLKAREAGIPVFTVGFGNPDVGHGLLLGDELVHTKLEEEPLKRIANETRGQYIPARTILPPLGEFFRSQLEPLPSREVSDDTLPLPKDRYLWFLAAALGFLLSGWVRGK